MANSEERTNAYTSSGSSSHQDEIRDKGRETADEVKQAARQKAEGVFDQQKGVAADQVHSLSSAFRKMAEELDDQDQGYFSDYATRMANCTGTLSERLRDQDMGSLMRQVRTYGREQPALFLGGAVAAGFMLARFVNSSQQRDEKPFPQDNGNMSTDVSSPPHSTPPGERADKGLY